jgi:ABC-2 type transport system permease protein
VKRDLLTVMWKEWKGLLRSREKRLQSIVNLVLPLAFFGIVWPWRAGHLWLDGAHTLGAALFIPMVLSMLTAPDSFAGERERHTLPTLLASRLPDGAILWGKILWNVAVSWGLVLAILVLGLVTANLATRDGGVAFYGTRTLVAAAGLSLLLSFLAVGVSIPLSLRASTAQEAMHAMGALMFLPALIGVVALVWLKNAKPDWSLETILTQYDLDMLLAIVMGGLVVVDLVLFAWAKHSFRRSRLIAR